MEFTAADILWALIIFFLVDFVVDLVRSVRIEMVKIDNSSPPMLENFDTINLYAEETNSTIFVYELKTNKFIASGKDIEEVSKNFHLRFPDKIGYFETGEHAYIIGLEEE